MSRPIPEIRARLYELAEYHGIDELRELADATHRRPAVRRTRRRLPKLTNDQIHRIKTMAMASPDMPMRDIARVVGTDQGRVSEVLNGLR